MRRAWIAVGIAVGLLGLAGVAWATKEALVPGWGEANETGTRQAMVPGQGYLNETVAVAGAARRIWIIQ